MLSTSTSIPISSISRMRRSPTSSMPGPRCALRDAPHILSVSGITQCACTSIVLMRFPPTLTSRRFDAGCVAAPPCPAAAASRVSAAASSRLQLVNTIGEGVTALTDSLPVIIFAPFTLNSGEPNVS
jgi:hypothetical protein